MYEDFYQLSGRPFQLTPDPKFFFGSKTHNKALAYLTYGLQQEEGFIIITGEIGAGKTTLIRHLLETLDLEEYIAALIVSTQINDADLLQAVAKAFKLDTQGLQKGELLAQIEVYLREVTASGKRAILIVDEAQNLPFETLEELRMLSNFQDEGQALLQSFLVGQPEFRDHIFASPELDQLRQRIIASHHLDALKADEIQAYIEHRLQQVGWENDPHFTDKAYGAIYEISGGIPRILNNLCGRLMLHGFLEEKHELTDEDVHIVSQEMQSEVGVRKRRDQTLAAGTETSGEPGTGSGGDELSAGSDRQPDRPGIKSLLALQVRDMEEKLESVEVELHAHRAVLKQLETMIAKLVHERLG